MSRAIELCRALCYRLSSTPGRGEGRLAYNQLNYNCWDLGLSGPCPLVPNYHGRAG